MIRSLRLRIRLLSFACVIAAFAAAAPARAGSVMLGRSLDGRPITATRVGDPHGKPVLVVGCIHGNETAGIAIARALAHTDPYGLDLWVVPDLNPDGVAAGTRGNARGVDLNRNFSWRWRPLGGVYASGARAFSEREARIARNLILRIHPQLTVWFHQHLDLTWASGGNRNVERLFARLAGLPYHPLPQLAGSAVTWQNNVLRGTTAFAAELPAGSAGSAETHRVVRALLAAARVA